MGATGMKFKTYKGETLTDANVSLKIDGVRSHTVDGEVFSRAGKPLYNIPAIYDVCEVFLGDWETTVSAVRTKDGPLISKEHLYSLEPIDPRLTIGHYEVLTPEAVKMLMQSARNKGYEGLVISSGGIRYKVKNEETYDVKVLYHIPGKGKHLGKMGALMTEKGKVGTGFSDKDRELDYTGLIVEVECMSLTPKGKFRHPRFKRVRYDKI